MKRRKPRALTFSTLLSSDEIGGYDRIVLSPHFDDAALCLGAAIARWSKAGKRVLVITFCAKAPSLTEVRGSVSAWRTFVPEELDPGSYMKIRKAEDRAALTSLGADLTWAPALDAIFRAPRLYSTRDKLFSGAHPADPIARQLDRWLRRLKARANPKARWYVPLGVGGHADHQALLQSALRVRLPGLRCYEDLPYASRKWRATEERLADLKRRAPALARKLRAHRIDGTKTFERKLIAVARYRTQIKPLFGTEDTLRSSLRAHAARVAGDPKRLAERIWRT